MRWWGHPTHTRSPARPRAPHTSPLTTTSATQAHCAPTAALRDLLSAPQALRMENGSEGEDEPALPSSSPSPRGPASPGAGELGGPHLPWDWIWVSPCPVFLISHLSAHCQATGLQPGLPLPASGLKGPLFQRRFWKGVETHQLSASHTGSEPRCRARPVSGPVVPGRPVGTRERAVPE